jgi:hypothetical protein
MLRLMPDLPMRLGLMPNLACRFRPARFRLDRPALNRLHPDGPALDWPAVLRRTMRRLATGWLGPVLTRRDDRRDRPSDPERAKPLIGVDIVGLDRVFAPGVASLAVLPVACRAVLARLTLSGLAPASAPPGHD